MPGRLPRRSGTGRGQSLGDIGRQAHSCRVPPVGGNRHRRIRRLKRRDPGRSSGKSAAEDQMPVRAPAIASWRPSDRLRGFRPQHTVALPHECHLRAPPGQVPGDHQIARDDGSRGRGNAQDHVASRAPPSPQQGAALCCPEQRRQARFAELAASYGMMTAVSLIPGSGAERPAPRPARRSRSSRPPMMVWATITRSPRDLDFRPDDGRPRR